MEEGTDTELKALSDSLEIGIGGLQLASERGLLWCFDNSHRQRCWTITDAARYVRQDRTLSGDKIPRSDGSEVKQRTVGKAASWPVGTADIKNSSVVLFCEGPSDFLAANHLIYCQSREADTAAVAMLGASQRIHEKALPYFSEKTVLLFPDYDSAGKKGASCWEQQLRTVNAFIKVYDFYRLIRDDGEPVEDLRDFLRVDYDQWERDPEVRASIPDLIGKEVCT